MKKVLVILNIQKQINLVQVINNLRYTITSIKKATVDKLPLSEPVLLHTICFVNTMANDQRK